MTNRAIPLVPCPTGSVLQHLLLSQKLELNWGERERETENI